jgi:2-succinyl-5-enolpyruvyl-6-hydroxy-3-cyclohexene-1-carboxylate synthase
LNAKSFKGDLLVILINNEGGGIFEHLPISNNKHFEDYFATPQSVDFETYCKAHHVNYELVENESSLVNALKGIQGLGLKVIEIKTNRKEDAKTFYKINQQR